MSKRDSLKFTVKKSLIVGTATATLATSGCIVNTGGGPKNEPGSDAGDATSTDVDTSDASGMDTRESPGDTAESDAGGDTSDGQADGTSSDDGGKP